MTKTQTPAQQQGFEIGRLYRVAKISEDALDLQRIEQVVEFVRDDRSICPVFRDIVTGVELFILLCDLEPYEQPTTTKQKLLPQELLLMYVKQHYPEDRVMIAMVENI